MCSMLALHASWSANVVLRAERDQAEVPRAQPLRACEGIGDEPLARPVVIDTHWSLRDSLPPGPNEGVVGCANG